MAATPLTVSTHPASSLAPVGERGAHESVSNALHRTLEAQRAAFSRGPPDHARRMDALAILRDAIHQRRNELVHAVSADFGGRATEETLLIELFLLSEQIKHARARLRSWMKPRRVGTSWFLLPSRAYVVAEPLGVVGVMSAWNFPLLITLGPVIDAIAAGNHVMIKPSEHAPRSAELIADVIARLYRPAYVATALGGPEVAAEFSALPFNHLLFTGSTHVGAMVMRAAAENLTPVTLELGGKCPAIVHESFSLDIALRRILVGKLYNAGQSCLAPDYLLVPAAHEETVARKATALMAELYPRLVGSEAYTRILRPEHYEQLTGALDEARQLGAQVLRANPAQEACTPENQVFAPTLVFGVPEHARLMREEIFGPILPVLTYSTLDDAIAFVNARPRPLAVYYFDDDASRARRVVARTHSGAVCINDAVFQFAQYGLPFGGVGASGMGQYHGVHGFRTFSKEKGVMIQSRWSMTRSLAPPYSDRTRAIIHSMLRLSRR